MASLAAEKVLRKTAFYPYSPEQVWVAITDPRAIAEWLMPNTFRPVVGHEFEFRTDPNLWCGRGVTRCEVTEVDPPRRLAYTWESHLKPGEAAKEPTLVRYTLTSESGGTRMLFEHIGAERFSFWQRLAMNWGWGAMINEGIPKVAANATPEGRFTPGAIPLSKRYYKEKTVPPEFAR